MAGLSDNHCLYRHGPGCVFPIKLYCQDIREVYLHLLILLSFSYSFFQPQRYKNHQKLKKASTYTAYTIAARQLDSRMGIDAWKRATGSSSHLFDEKLIVKITKRLREYRLAVSEEKTSKSRKRELLGEMIRVLRQGGCKANVRSYLSLIIDRKHG
jgi:hypothetical protein